MVKYSKETRRMVGRVLQSSAQSNFTWSAILGVLTLMGAAMFFQVYFQVEKTTELGQLAIALPVMGTVMGYMALSFFVKAFKSFRQVQEYSVAI